MTTSRARKYPSPGNTSFAISCARFPDTAMMRQMFSWAAISTRMEIRMTNAKLAMSCSVKTVVCVRNPGPIADVAMRNAAPSRTLRFCFF